MKKIGMKIFKAMNWIMGVTFFVSACAVDAESWFPTIVCALSIAYLGCALYIWEALKANK